MLYTFPWVGFELTSVVIGSDCIGSCKFNYHNITATTAPNLVRKKVTMLTLEKYFFQCILMWLGLFVCVCQVYLNVSGIVCACVSVYLNVRGFLCASYMCRGFLCVAGNHLILLFHLFKNREYRNIILGQQQKFLTPDLFTHIHHCCILCYSFFL